MLQVLVLVLGATIGVVGSRMLRRPAPAASAGSVARNVGGALGARRGLSLPELQRATFSEMMRHVRVRSGGPTLVPSRYLVQLHPDDAAVVEESPRFFTDGLDEALRDAARTQGWSIDGPVTISIEADGARRPGAPAVLAVPPGRPASQPPTPAPEAPTVAAMPSPAPRPARPVSTPRPMMLERLDRHEVVPLTSGPITIGRSSDRDVVIDDNRVSRHHAVVAPHGSGWIVTDSRSSNGTRLNGSALVANQAATLHAGDSIQVGPVTFRFDVDQSRIRPPDAPTREPLPDDRAGVLDDATRERISGEYRWPGDDAEPGSPGRDA